MFSEPYTSPTLLFYFYLIQPGVLKRNDCQLSWWRSSYSSWLLWISRNFKKKEHGVQINFRTLLQWRLRFPIFCIEFNFSTELSTFDEVFGYEVKFYDKIWYYILFKLIRDTMYNKNCEKKTKLSTDMVAITISKKTILEKNIKKNTFR